jgi:hypothetical protein
MTEKEFLKTVPWSRRYAAKQWWRQRSICPRCLRVVQQGHWTESRHFWGTCTPPRNPWLPVRRAGG